MICTKKRIILCVILLIAILIFIWGNSLMPAAVSQKFSDWVQSLLLGQSQTRGASSGSGILRKAAHFAEFTALGMCVCWLFGMLGKGKLLPFAWGVAVACIDETIQGFVPGRAPGLLDVCIDSCGVLTGIVLLWMGHTYFKKKSTNRSLEDK